MSTRIWIVLALIFMFTTMTPIAATEETSQTATPTPQPTVEITREKMTSQALAGNLLGDPTERTVYVVLPPGYTTSDKRYPVVYVMPWDGGDPGANTWGFKTAMESLLDKGEIKEMIVIVPDGTNKLSGGLFLSSPTLGDYETYATQEVVNYVDTHYRTRPTRGNRGLAGCSRGGTTSMRLGLKYPTIFSVVAATSGEWDFSPEVWPSDVKIVRQMKKMPKNVLDINDVTGWWIQLAAATSPAPGNPPFYCDMPFRIVDEGGEFIPEVIARIVETDAAHEARRYVQQPVRLRGILLRHGVYDTNLSLSVHSFVHVLTELGIEHEYVEEKAGHCGFGWEKASLKYMSDKLVFEEK